MFITRSVLALTTLTFLDLGAAQAAVPYHFDPLICMGNIQQPAPAQVHSSYHKVLIKMTAFNTRRRDRSFAQTLKAELAYAEPTASLDVRSANFGEIIYTSPLQMDEVSRVAGHANLNGRGSMLEFNSVNFSLLENGSYLDAGHGRYTVAEASVTGGSYTYNLACAGIRLSEPVKIIDNTVP